MTYATTKWTYLDQIQTVEVYMTEISLGITTNSLIKKKHVKKMAAAVLATHLLLMAFSFLGTKMPTILPFRGIEDCCYGSCKQRKRPSESKRETTTTLLSELTMKKKVLKIGLINANRRVDTSKMIQRAIELQYDLVGICEPPKNTEWTVTTKFQTFAAGTGSRAIIVLLNNKLVAEEICAMNDIMMIKLKYLNIQVACIYIQPQDSARRASTQKDVEEVSEMVKELIRNNVDKTVIIGDLNARTELMGDTLTNTRGRTLLSELEKAMWVVINNPGVLTFKTQAGRNGSIVDWCAVTQDLYRGSTWEIDEDTQLDSSDHHFICVQVRTVKAFYRTEVKTILPLSNFLKRIKALQLANDATKAYGQVLAVVDDIKRPVRFKSNNFVMTTEMMYLRDILKSTRSKKTREELEYSRMVRRMLDQAISHARKTTRPATAAQRYDEIIKELREKRKGPVLSINVDGANIFDDKRIAEIALNHFYPQQTTEQDFPVTETANSDDFPFTLNELKAAVYKPPLKSAPGRDMVSSVAMRAWFEQDPHGLLRLYNDIFTATDIPAELKDTKIVLIKKKNEGPNTLDNIRPIGLQSKIGKTLELMISDRLTHHIDTCWPMHCSQFGFKKGSSTLHAMAIIDQIRSINATLELKEAMVSIDIRGAYNNISTAAVLRSLHERQIPNNLYKLLVAYFAGRTASMDTADGPIYVPMNRGVAQGSSLGPLLFNLAMDDVIRDMESDLVQGVSLIAFADDLTFIIAGWDDLEQLQAIISTTFAKLKLLLAEKGLEIAVNKTQVMTSYQSPHAMANNSIDVVEIDEEIIPVQRTMKILGVTLDSEGSYLHHVLEVNQRAEKRIEEMKHKFDRSFHHPMGTRTRLLRSHFHSLFTYCSGVWFNPDRPRFAQVLHKIEEINRKLTIMHLNLYKTTPYSAVLAVTEAPPLVETLYKESAVQRQVLTGHHSRTGRRISSETHPKDRQHPARRANFPTEYVIQNGDTLFTESYGYAVVVNATVKIINGERRTAAGFIADNGSLMDRYVAMKRLTNGTSIYHLAAAAMSSVCDFFLERRPTGTHIVITKSESLLKALNNYTNQDEAINLIRDKISRLRQSGIILKLVRLPAMIETIEMERLTDGLRLAINFPIEQANDMPISLGLVKEEAKLNAQRIVADMHLQMKSKSMAHDFFPTIADARAQHVRFDPYSSLFYTGHCPTREYLDKVRLKSGNKCRCGAVQSVPHVLLECRLYDDILDVAKKESGLEVSAHGLSNQQILKLPAMKKFVQKISKPLYRRLVAENFGGSTLVPT